MEEGKAQEELLGAHLGRRRHHGRTRGCEGTVQVDIGILAADADARTERDSAEDTAVVNVVEGPGRCRWIDGDAARGGAHDVQLRRVGRVLFGRAQGCLSAHGVAPEADRRGGAETSRFEDERGPNAIEHETGRQYAGGDGVTRSGVVGSHDRPPSAEGSDHERKFLLVALSQRVGRIGRGPQAVDGALIGEQWPDRPLEGPPGNHHGGDG